MPKSKNVVSLPKRVPTTVRNMFFEDPHFMDNWEDFDQVKKSMFKESRDVWKKMDQDFRQAASCHKGPTSTMIIINDHRFVKEIIFQNN